MQYTLNAFKHGGLTGAAKGVVVGAATGLGVSAAKAIIMNPAVLEYTLKGMGGAMKGASKAAAPVTAGCEPIATGSCRVSLSVLILCG